MAEVLAAIGIVASVAQLADYGFKLSLKLYTFSSTVSSASTSIKALSSDVSLTSTVLQELCLIIKSDEGSHVVSDTAIHATSQTVKECLAVFEQLNEALDKSMRGMEERGGKRVVEKLKWPFKQPKMDLLRGNLDRLKASLTLMLQVLSYARDVSNRKAAHFSLLYQKQVIENLARSERDMNRKYINMQRALEFDAIDRDFYSTMNSSVHKTTFSKTPVDSDIMAKTTSVNRSFPPDAEPKSLSTETIDTPPPVKPRTLIGELLLCFQLLNDILGYHMAVSQLSDIVALGYDDLRGALCRVQDQEFKKLEAQHASASVYMKAEAAKNLQIRLRELARAGFLTKRETALKEDLGASPGNFLESQPSVTVPEMNHPVMYHLSSPAEPEEIVPYDPYMTYPIGYSRTEALQAEIDSTVGIMRESINRVSQRGDRLDSLQDKTDNLATSAQGFRRGANRVRKAQWRVTPLSAIAWLGMAGAEAVQGIGSGVVKASRGIGEAIYNAGENILSGLEGEVEKDEFVGSPVRIVGGRFEDAESDEDEKGDEHENEGIDSEKLVDDLLAQWTTLSDKERDVTSSDAWSADEE